MGDEMTPHCCLGFLPSCHSHAFRHRLLQTVHFKPNPSFQPTHWDEQAFLNVCEVDPSSSFLVVCNQKESTACVLRIKTPYIDVDSDQLETRCGNTHIFLHQLLLLRFVSMPLPGCSVNPCSLPSLSAPLGPGTVSTAKPPMHGGRPANCQAPVHTLSASPVFSHL